MELLDAIKGRRSIRSYQNKKIPKPLLEEVMEAAIWAPTGSNAQAWKFIVVDDDANIKKIKS